MSKTTPTPVAVELDGSDVVTMYGAHKYLAEAFGLNVRPQMLYTYGRKGYIPTVEADGKRTTVTALTEWANAYAERRVAKVRAQEAKVQAELKG